MPQGTPFEVQDALRKGHKEITRQDIAETASNIVLATVSMMSALRR